MCDLDMSLQATYPTNWVESKNPVTQSSVHDDQKRIKLHKQHTFDLWFQEAKRAADRKRERCKGIVIQESS